MRVGRIRISETLLEEKPDLIEQILEYVCADPVYRGRSRDDFTQEIVLKLISPLFDDIEDGNLIPEYVIVIEHKDGKDHFKEVQKI